MPPASRKTAGPPERRKITLELPATIHDLAANALEVDADRRRRAGMKISGELTEERRRTGADVRGGAVKVVEILAEADALQEAANALRIAWDAAEVLPSPELDDDDDDEAPPTPPAPEDPDDLVRSARRELGLPDEPEL